MEETKNSKKKIRGFHTERGHFTLTKTKNPYQITRQKLSEFADREKDYKIAEKELEEFSRAQSEIGIRTSFSTLASLVKGREERLERE